MRNMLSRRDVLQLMGYTTVGSMISSFCNPLGKRNIKHNEDIDGDQQMLKRPIYSSGELLPVVGLGTWIQFDVGVSESDRQPLREVLKFMASNGGKVIDSSPMYGMSEEVIGDLTSELPIADQFFYATKVWISGEQNGISQMEASMRKMRRNRIDLMQVHNLIDWKTHMRTLKKWKEEGKIRYIGVTHYTNSSHIQLEQLVKSEKIDFVQFNYSIRGRNAEKSLLNAARDNGVSVIINQPFDSGSLFDLVRGKKLPGWAQQYDIQTWAQFFLKYLLSHPAVTCVIPGTSNPQHLVENMKAGYGELPDEKARKKMVDFFENI